MIVYRISNPVHSNDISGTGAKLVGARWNSIGTPVLYTSQHISLSVLEMLVHTDFKDYSIALDLIYIRIPDQETVSIIEPGNLKLNWRDDPDYTRFIGDEFIRQKKSLLLRVPSVLVDEEFNYLANPLHTDFKKIKIIKTKSFRPDRRLLKI